MVETTARRVVRLLQRRGLLEQGASDPLWEDEPLLAELTAASIQGWVATGEPRGERVRRRLADPEEGIQWWMTRVTSLACCTCTRRSSAP